MENVYQPLKCRITHYRDFVETKPRTYFINKAGGMAFFIVSPFAGTFDGDAYVAYQKDPLKWTTPCVFRLFGYPFVRNRIPLALTAFPFAVSGITFAANWNPDAKKENPFAANGNPDAKKENPFVANGNPDAKKENSFAATEFTGMLSSFPYAAYE